MNEIKEVLLPQILSDGREYLFEIHQKSMMGRIAHENTVHMTVKKQSIPTKHGMFYELNVTNRKQSDTEGIREIEQDLFFLQEKMTLQTNAQGEVLKITNLPDIRTLWEKNKKGFRKKYKTLENIDELVAANDELLENSEAFTDNIKQSDIVTLLFPPIYSKIIDEETSYEQEKDFSGFFGEVTLPLKLTTTFKQRKKLNVLREGILDDERFDDHKVTNLFRTLADNYQLGVKVIADYLETYDLDEQNWITHAGQLINVKIQGLFYYQQIVRVTPLKK